jgi:hypothetical protein
MLDLKMTSKFKSQIKKYQYNQEVLNQLDKCVSEIRNKKL